jgi:mannose-6-phosphate isomerase-like protein (cupin superfamily)
MRTPRLVVAALAILCYPVFAGTASAQSKVTYVDAAKVTAGGTFTTTPEYAVQMLKRTAAGQAEVHLKETDIFYIVEGAATIVTGGTVVDGKVTQPNQLRGTAIQGGDTFQLKKGDAITIPAGVPHWFKDVPQSIQYFTVKSITP